MDIYTESYKREISGIEDDIERGVPTGVNSTHYGLGILNRASMIVIGLCSLVEALLYEIASKEEQKNSFKIDDLKGTGLVRNQTYLSRTGIVDFGKIPSWGDFKKIYIIRNALVHSYGGLVESTDMTKVSDALAHFKFKNVLIGGRRIRMTSESLHKTISVVETTIESLKRVSSIGEDS